MNGHRGPYECQRCFKFKVRDIRRTECDSCRDAAQQVWPGLGECAEVSGG